MRLRDRHVLITGGSRGIGRAVADAVADAGARVTLVARSEGPLTEAAGRMGAATLVADLTRPGDTAAVIDGAEDRNGPVDVLVNNAGLDLVGDFTAQDAEDLRRLWEVNAVAPCELARRVLPGMLQRRLGRVVFVSSLSAEVALPGLTAYSATKAAVSQLAEGLRADLAGTGVGVTTVELGPVDTGMYDAVQAVPATAAAFDKVLRLRALRKLTVTEVAHAVLGAVVDDRASVVLPRRARPQWALARSPQRLTDLLLGRRP